MENVSALTLQCKTVPTTGGEKGGEPRPRQLHLRVRVRGEVWPQSRKAGCE